MPETRLAKTRPMLPMGYQFGDARPVHVPGVLDPVSLSYPCSCGGRWYMGFPEPYHVNVLKHWNVIEGEHHDPDQWAKHLSGE